VEPDPAGTGWWVIKKEMGGSMEEEPPSWGK